MSTRQKKASASKDELLDPKTKLFKKGNPGGPGRPPKPVISDREALILMKNKLTEYGSLDEAAEVMWNNAFRKEGRDGSKGSISWAKLVLEYLIGPPTVRVENTTINVAEVMRAAMSNHVAAATVIDIEPDDD